MSDQKWVHATNAAQYREGSVCGWRDDASPTGYLSGIVVMSDPSHLRVMVRDIQPATMGQKETA
jgi:hypothetical protein